MANSTIKPIQTEEDYEAALARIDVLMGAEPDSPEFDELDVLADLVDSMRARTSPWAIPAQWLRSSSAWSRGS